MCTRFTGPGLAVVLVLTLASLAGIAVPLSAQRPDAELKGITALGLVVEEMGAQTLACGFSRETFEKAVATALADAGLKVLRNSDEDTYLYVNVRSLGVPANLCVTRFDVTLFTHTTARLSYQTEPVLVQVSLLHSGGLTGGGVAGHADNVLKSVRQSVDQFVSRIRAANK